jgi:glycosyltransferase involved in cell wall biosynthesis
VQVLPALQAGGVERGTLEVAAELVRHGHQSIVISGGGRMVTDLVAGGSEHIEWPIGRKSPWTLRLVPRLRAFLRERQPDILHARSRLPAWVAYLAWRGMDAATRPRFVTTVHGIYRTGFYSSVMMRSERVIAVSEAVKNYILANYSFVRPETITVIHRGIDPAQFPHGFQPSAEWLVEWRKTQPQLAGKKILTLPARLTRLKGHEDFIALIGALKAQGLPVHGLAVGDLSQKKIKYFKELQNSILTAGLKDDISFLGHRQDVREIMAVSDLVLSLSLQPEACPRTVIEPLSMGKPVLCYDHGGVTEILKAAQFDGGVPLGDLAALAEKAKSLLEKPAAVAPWPIFRLQDMLDKTLTLYGELKRPS